MRPDEIQHRDFLVGLRGYDKDEVRTFLAEVAAEHAALQRELETTREAGPAAVSAAPAPATPAGPDDFENLGASVAAILRTAKESAAEITAAAEARTAKAREEIEDLRYRAVVHADELRAAAQSTLDDAKAEAERIVAEATERARQLDIESEARITRRHEDAARREAAIKARLVEATEELQLALVALETDVASTNGLEPAEAV